MLHNVLEISLSMSVVMVLMLLLMPLFKRRYKARLRYFIWLIIAIRLCIPFNVTLPKAPVKIETMQRSVVLHTEGKAPYLAENNSNQERSSADTVINPDEILLYLWIAGASGFMFFQTAVYLLFRRKIKPYLVKYNIECELPVFICKRIPGPMVVGFVKPVILLPDEEYTKEELDIILAHELMHYRRHDLWYKLLLVTANALHFFNPIVYVMVRHANRDIEYSCDDEVCNNREMEFRKEYSLTILKSIRQNKNISFSTNFSEGGRNAKKRFESLLSSKGKKTGVLLFTVFFVIAVLIGCFISLRSGKDIEASKSYSHINELLGIICSSPKVSSNPGDYIKEHAGEFNDLKSFNQDMLEYSTFSFETGNQTDLKGHIMMLACREILGAEDIQGSYETGQQWYDAFKAHAIHLNKTKGKEYLKSNCPKTEGVMFIFDALKSTIEVTDELSTARYRGVMDWLKVNFEEEYKPYYEILDLYASNYKENMTGGNFEATFFYTMVHKNYYKDPDTIDYIKKAKEKGSTEYENMFNEYNAPRYGNYEFKVKAEVSKDGKLDTNTFELYTNTAPKGEAVWERCEISDFIGGD